MIEDGGGSAEDGFAVVPIDGDGGVLPDGDADEGVAPFGTARLGDGRVDDGHVANGEVGSGLGSFEGHVAEEAATCGFLAGAFPDGNGGPGVAAEAEVFAVTGVEDAVKGLGAVEFDRNAGGAAAARVADFEADGFAIQAHGKMAKETEL